MPIPPQHHSLHWKRDSVKTTRRDTLLPQGPAVVEPRRDLPLCWPKAVTVSTIQRAPIVEPLDSKPLHEILVFREGVLSGVELTLSLISR